MILTFEKHENVSKKWRKFEKKDKVLEDIIKL